MVNALPEGHGEEKKRGKRKAGGPPTAAGLIRFYEEMDVGVKIKPHYVIIIALLFTAIIIAFSKLLPP